MKRVQESCAVSAKKRQVFRGGVVGGRLQGGGPEDEFCDEADLVWVAPDRHDDRGVSDFAEVRRQAGEGFEFTGRATCLDAVEVKLQSEVAIGVMEPKNRVRFWVYIRAGDLDQIVGAGVTGGLGIAGQDRIGRAGWRGAAQSISPSGGSAMMRPEARSTVGTASIVKGSRTVSLRAGP